MNLCNRSEISDSEVSHALRRQDTSANGVVDVHGPSTSKQAKQYRSSDEDDNEGIIFPRSNEFSHAPIIFPTLQ